MSGRHLVFCKRISRRFFFFFFVSYPDVPGKASKCSDDPAYLTQNAQESKAKVLIVRERFLKK